MQCCFGSVELGNRGTGVGSDLLCLGSLCSYRILGLLGHTGSGCWVFGLGYQGGESGASGSDVSGYLVEAILEGLLLSWVLDGSYLGVGAGNIVWILVVFSLSDCLFSGCLGVCFLLLGVSYGSVEVAGCFLDGSSSWVWLLLYFFGFGESLLDGRVIGNVGRFFLGVGDGGAEGR